LIIKITPQFSNSSPLCLDFGGNGKLDSKVPHQSPVRFMAGASLASGTQAAPGEAQGLIFYGLLAMKGF